MSPITYEDIFVILACVAGVIVLLLWGLGLHIANLINRHRRFKQ